MPATVRFIDAVLPPLLAGASRDFEEGSVTEIVAAGEDECALLVKAIAGLAPLSGGGIAVLGEDPSVLSRHALCALRFRIGIVHPGGGMISNLKVVENVALPLLYHSGRGGREVSERAAACLARAGYSGNLFELPGRLTTFQRRAAGVARVLAADPDLVVHDRLTSGLSAAERDALLRTAFEFHGEKPGRATIFISPRSGSAAGAGPAAVVHLTKGRFE